MSINRVLIGMATLAVVTLGLGNWAHAQSSAVGTPVAYWQFENGDLTSDSSGNGNSLINLGATWVADDCDGEGTNSNGSVYFNGIDSWMTTLNTLNLSSYEAIRISWWMKAEKGSGIMFEQTSNFNENPGGWYASSTPYGTDPTLGGTGFGYPGAQNHDSLPYTTGVWEKQVVEFRPLETDPAKVVKVWHNGVLQEDDAPWGGVACTKQQKFVNDIFHVGTRGGSGYFFDGYIDDMIIEDINGGSTIAQWEFNQGNDFLMDSSGNGHNLLGTVVSSMDDFNGSGLGSAFFDNTAGLQTADALDLSSYTHLRVSWKMKTTQTGGGHIIYELSPNCNENDGSIVTSLNSVGTGNGLTQVTWNGAVGGNGDLFPQIVDGTWAEYSVEYNLDATDPAKVVVVTVNGVEQTDVAYGAKHSLANIVGSFTDDYLYFGARQGTIALYGGYLDEVLVESIPYEPEESPLTPGDANGDGKVDGSDVTILAGNWQVLEGATWDMGDFNGDHKVDGSDVTILAGNWQAGVTTAAASVPEPSTLVLLVLGTVSLLIWKRR